MSDMFSLGLYFVKKSILIMYMYDVLWTTLTLWCLSVVWTYICHTALNGSNNLGPPFLETWLRCRSLVAMDISYMLCTYFFASFCCLDCVSFISLRTPCIPCYRIIVTAFYNVLPLTHLICIVYVFHRHSSNDD